MSSPEYKTPGVILRRLSLDDAEEYFQLIDRNRRHLSRYGDFHDERVATPEWVAEHLARLGSLHSCYGIWLAEELAGRVDLVPVDPPKYGFGYWLDEAHTGRGVATSACRSALALARDELGATEIFAGVTHGNQPSVRLLQGLGFVPIERFSSYSRFHLVLDLA